MRGTAEPAASPAAPSRRGIGSWLKIQVESENYQPPRAGLILLQVLVGLMFFVLVTRFWYLQLHKGAEFTRQAQENRLRAERIFAPRGRILDDKGHVLCDNRIAYGLSITRDDCRDIPATLAQISQWSGIPLTQIWDKFRQDSARLKSFEPLLLITDIEFDMVARIASEIHAWPGLEIVVRSKRSYPERDLFAHVLGYVAEASEQEMAADDTLAMGDLVGKQGLELKLEKLLRGSKGLYELEVDAHARVLGKTLRDEPRGGEELHLSLDSGLQKAAWDALDGAAGCVVVMEPDSGKLRALVTSPAYDNNLFAAGISRKDWEALRTNERAPLQNRVIQSVYPPGSVWKLVMATMLLEQGVSPHDTVFCPGQVKLGNQIFRCWRRGGHGAQDLVHSLINSCDVYYYLMGERMGIDRIEAFAKACGFGRPTGIDLPHERSGLVPSRAWKQRRFGRAWARGETYNISIGQGFTLVTPVQVAVFVSALLNGGDLLKPQLLENAPRVVQGRVPAKPQTLAFVVEAMRRTANGGTAKVVARKDADMGGKTGTAQVTKLKMAGERRLRTSELEYKQRDHAWIATWGVKNGKAYVVVVLVEHGGGGSSVAGPVARKVYDYMFGDATAALASQGQAGTAGRVERGNAAAARALPPGLPSLAPQGTAPRAQ